MDTLHLTIFNPVHTALTDSACESYIWNNITYTTSGTYTHNHTDIHGCTQVDTLHLTVFHPQHTAYTVVECETYTWNGTTYTTSGTYTHSHQDAHSCTQVDTLHLTIGHPTHLATTVTECESYTWNGNTYTTSGNYTYAHLDMYGCTQVDTLHLTIFNPVHTALTDSTCESYTWNGTVYENTGTYTHSHPDAHGCTQVDTLHLTVFHPQHTAYTVVECETYTWDLGTGLTYTESGTYTHSHTDAHGCTQVDTLYLTINFPTHTAATVYVCADYIWNGQTYTTDGDYTFAHLDDNGCEQVDTLHLIYVSTDIRVISLTSIFCENESAVLEVQCELTDYQWSTGETTPTITVYEAGTYTVTATQGECVLEDEITILPCPHPLILPNAFTPNSDGLNDYFSIPEGSLDEVQDNDFRIYIYNRWGEVVFTSTSKYFQWNGEFKGHIYNNTIYNYVIFYRDIIGEKVQMSGSIMIL